MTDLYYDLAELEVALNTAIRASSRAAQGYQNFCGSTAYRVCIQLVDMQRRVRRALDAEARRPETPVPVTRGLHPRQDTVDAETTPADTLGTEAGYDALA